MLHSRIDYNRTMPLLQYARVERVGDDGDLVTVKTPRGEIEARRAVSCLLRPVEGDEVLLSSDSRRNGYVLSVLTREQDTPAVMRFDGDVTLHARGGDMSLRCDNTLICQADGLDMAASRAEMAIDDAEIVAREASVAAKRLETVIGGIEQICGTLIQRLGRYFRHTAGHEEKQAGSSTHMVSGTLAVTSENTVMQSRETTRIDGETIQVG